MFFLIGYMCAGKTTIGKQLAQLLKCSFYDLDSIIEHKYNNSIHNIFKIFGEDYFRNIETDVLKELINTKEINAIISCGGGTPCYNNNLELMKNSGIIVYLKVEPQIIVKRINDSDIIRPVVANNSGNNLLDFVTKQLSKREYFYYQADIIAEGVNLMPEKLFQLIFDK